MKVAMRIAVALLLAAGVAVAQTPAPVAAPEQGPPPGGQYKTPAPGGVQAKLRRSPGPAPMAEMRPDLGAWWKNSDMVQEIGLSQEQVKRIEDTFYDHRLKLIDLKANVEREETKLQPLMEADTVNEAQIGPQIDKVLAARIALEKANVMMMLSIRKVLTVDQWKKLESMRDRREGMMKRKMEEEESMRMKRRMGPGYTPAPPPPGEPDFDPERPGEAANRIPVDSDVQQSQLVHHVKPAYSDLAKQARIQGTVRLRAIIARDGRVAQLDVVNGHPLLIQSALEAVRRWRYQPTLRYGEPMEVMTTVDVAFRLNDETVPR